MNATCESCTVCVVAPIRSAMKRSASGLMAWSPAETRYHDGIDFQPAAEQFSLRVAAATGR